MSDRRKYVNGITFNRQDPDFVFPESIIPRYKEKLDAGLCFSGGGTRASTLAAGQLRALNKAGILDRFGYVSCVSGGSWSIVPYVFLDRKIDDDVFLGEYIPPDRISLSVLELSDCKSLIYSSSHAHFIDDLPKTLFSGDECYSEMVGATFLAPYNISSEKRFFTLDSDSLLSILKRNTNLNSSDFYMTKTEPYRPFLIVNGIIIRPGHKRYHFEMTPLYVGTSTYHPGAGSNQKYSIGGGYVEPHIFDSDSPGEQLADGSYRVRLGHEKHMFTLSDVIGVSSSAPAEFFYNNLDMDFIFPEFKYWVPNEPDKAKEYDFGDGGLLENIGIMPLMKRKVKRIIAFVNCKSNIFEGEMPSSITALFRALPDLHGAGDFRDNIVLQDDGKYEVLKKALLKSAQEGKGAIHTDVYKVLDQSFYGIAGDFNVKITWVVNAIARQWSDQLPIEVKKNLESGIYGRKFPHLATAFQNFPEIINLGVEQANLMAHHSAWIVNENLDEFSLDN